MDEVKRFSYKEARERQKKFIRYKEGVGLYLDVNSDFRKYNDILEKIKDYINGIQMFMNQAPFMAII